MTDDKKTVQLFDQNAGDIALANSDAAAVARATQEIQASLVIAQRFPRDEVRVKAKIIEACKRVDLAEVSEYEYSRGGTKITGPTIDLLRAIANRWGNIRHGWQETERANGVSSVRCFAWDMQTNSQAERTFKVRHWRDTQSGGHALRDERDIYEVLANAAARRVRACLEEVIDSDVVLAAVDQCRLTLKNGAGQGLLKDRAVGMVTAFADFGVTQTMMEARIGNKLEAISENQFASLKRVYKSIRDGVGTVEEHFKPVASAPQFDDKPGAAAGPAASQQTNVGTAQPAQQTPTPAAAPAPTPEQQPKQPGDRSGYNPLKALRMLLKAGSIKENELLDFLSSTGATDGSQASLEDVMLTAPSVINSTAENFAPIAEKIKEARGK